MSLINENEEPKKYFSHVGEVEYALENKTIELHTSILYRTNSYNSEKDSFEYKKYTTSAGRVILFKTVPESKNLPFDVINKVLTKKDISNLFDNVYRFTVHKDTWICVDLIMTVGFMYAATVSLSVVIDVFVIPDV